MSKGMITKILVGVSIVAVAVPMMLIGGSLVRFLLAAIVILASYEIASLKDQEPHWYFTVFLAMSIMAITRSPEEMRLPLIGIYLTVLVIVGLTRGEYYDIQYLAIVFFVSAILIIALTTVDRIYASSLGGIVMIYICLACYLCDSGAYFFGTFMGHHKMVPLISPHKTWEGAFGGYFCGVLGSWLFAHFLCPQVPGQMQFVVSFVLPAVAEVGDLAFSMIKRKYGIKDYGSIFPGHGGILDRVDSLLFCLMVFYPLMIVWGF